MRTGRTLHPEDLISRYRVVGPLGAGGMGEVYLAQDQTLERNVALKVLPPELVKDPDRVRRFVLEAKSASSLSHPNIVTIYEIGQDVVRTKEGGSDSDSTPVQYMSMELINGRTLSTIIHDGNTDVRTLLGYLAQAAEGLAKAHAAGIVHRDLKPGNIMVTADGFTKVLDFGLAKLTENRDPDPEQSSAPTRLEDATGAGAVIGTTGYMSPEQVQGKPVDHRSDIFSFGCLLYEAVTRHRPFVADSAVETMHKILHDKPAPVEEWNPRAPAELRRVIRRCLAKSADQRVQSMKDVALELREIADEWDTLSTSGTSGSTIVGAPASSPAKPRRRLAVIAGIGIVVLASVAVATWMLRGAPKSDASQPFQTMKLSTQTSRGDVTEAAISLDGRYLAYLTGEVGKSSVRVRQVATGSDVEVVPSEEGLFEGLSFSPDGNYLYYLKRRRDTPNYRALMQVPSLGGASRERAFDVDSRASFSPDGKRAVFARGIPQERKTEIVVLDLDSGQERPLASILQPHTVSGAPSWSPDGRHIALIDLDTATGAFVTTLAVLDAASGRREDLNVAKGAIHESVAWLADGSGLVRSGFDLGTSAARQVSVVDYPGGSARRITNDVNDYRQVSASAGDEAIAAVRFNRMSNLWLADADAGGGEARPITKFTNAENSPFGFVTDDDGSIVFCAAHDRSLQLWSIGPNGGEPRALTTGDTLAANPKSFPGGVVYDRWDDKGGIHVWRVGIDGSQAKILTPSAPAQVRDVGRDGKFATYVQLDADAAIWVLPTAGGPPRSLGPRTSGGLISPDGARVLVFELTSGQDGLIRSVTKIVRADGGAVETSVPVPAPDITTLGWGPGSTSLTFLDAEDPTRNLTRIGVAGGAPVRLTHFTDGRTTAFSWSPNGSRVALARRIGDSSNVWVAAADGSKPVQITRFQGDEIFALDWSKDGKHVVVSAGRRSSDAVLIRNFR